jgi:hypothetical protein
MTAKNTLHPKREQPKPLPAAFNEQGQENLSIHENHISCLGEARLKTEGVEAAAHIDAINYLHRRAASLCDIVGQAGYSESGSEMPSESLAVVMDIIREDVQVAGWIAGKLDDLRGDRRCFPTGGAA